MRRREDEREEGRHDRSRQEGGRHSAHRHAEPDYRQQGNFRSQAGTAVNFSSGEPSLIADRPRTPRPYGRLSIFTLTDDMTAEFDRIAEEAAEGVRLSEPDTLVYVIHVVPKAPMQRIIYEIYRDRAAFESHESQPHIRRFAEARKSCVLATNIIDLRLKFAKVAALFQGGGQAVQPEEPAPRPEPSWTANQRGGQYDSWSGGQYRGPGAESGSNPRGRPPWEDEPDSSSPRRRYGD